MFNSSGKWSPLGKGLLLGRREAWEQVTGRSVRRVERAGFFQALAKRAVTVHFNEGDSLEARLKRTNPVEIHFYTSFRSSFPLLLPEILHIEEAGGQGLLVYRSLPAGKGIRAWDRADASAVLRDLAKLHAAFWEKETDLQSLDSLISLLSADLDEARRGVVLLMNMGGWPGFITPEVLRRMVDLLSDEDRLLAPLRSLPQTLLHGDPWQPNWVILPEQRALLDWQTAMRGPALWDLAYLLEFSGEAGGIFPLDQEEALKIYLDALEAELGKAIPEVRGAFCAALNAVITVQILTRWPVYAARSLALFGRFPALAVVWRALPGQIRYWIGARAAWTSPAYYQRAFAKLGAKL